MRGRRGRRESSSIRDPEGSGGEALGEAGKLIPEVRLAGAGDDLAVELKFGLGAGLLRSELFSFPRRLFRAS